MNQNARQILTAVFLTLALAIPTAAQSVRRSTAGDTALRSETVHISSIRTDNLSSGSRITITSNQPLTDYGAYRNGDNFMVLIPGAELALTEINATGAGFTDAKVEGKGTNLAFSFRLETGVSVSVSQIENKLALTVTPPTADARVMQDGDGGSSSRPASPAPQPATSTPALTSNTTNNESTASPTATSTALATPLQTTQATGSTADNANQREVDLSVPESPAFTVLGVNPETVTRPTTPRAFATSLLNGVDDKGNFQSGLALDFVPYLTFFGSQTSLSSYRSNRMERFLARTQLSFATTKGATDADKSSRLALGLRFTLWDQGDPRLDQKLDTCYADALNDPRLTGRELRTFPGETDAQKEIRLAKRKTVLAEVVKPCNDSARKRNWNASGWIVGLAPSWISKTGQTKDFIWNGGGFWTSVAYGFNSVDALKDNSQLIFHARYRTNESVPDPNDKGKFFTQDSLFLGSRLRIAPGSEAKSILSFEGVFLRSRRNKGTFDNSSRYSLGFEQRVSDNIWFALSLGGQSGQPDGNNQPFVLSSFKWGFSPKK
jgi:hypothetical protein